MKILPFERWISALVRPLETLNLIQISQQAVLSNYDFFQNLHPNSFLFPVVKSNAYGHGLPQMVDILRHRSFPYYVADSYWEALKIWQLHRHPVLLIGPIHPQNYRHMDFNRLAFAVSDCQSLEAIGQTGRRVNVHLKVNTGLNRQGIDPQAIPVAIDILKKYPQIHLEGVMSHLADADNPVSTHTARQQLLFRRVCRDIQRRGLNPRYLHLSATYGTNKPPASEFNTIRLGIGLYGYGPFNGLHPALSLLSTFTKIAPIKKGDCVGYGCTYTALRPSNIGVIPLVYFEGLDRRLSNLGHVRYQNHFLPIIGRISMNLTVVDLGKLTPKLFDQVEVYGPDSSASNSISKAAEICQTIPYDLLVHLNESIRRVVVN